MNSSFENLPNELISMIFNYLSALDVFYSFSKLNERFSSLIQSNLPVQLDFSTEILSKNDLIDFLRQCRSMSIHSIRLSNRDYLDGISLFLTYFPLFQLRHVQSLTLIDANENQIERFFRNSPNLRKFSFTSMLWRSFRSDFLSVSTSLTDLHLPSLDLLKKICPNLRNLRVDRCSSETLSKLNRFAPNLRSLTLILTVDSSISQLKTFPHQLESVRLVVRSIIFDDFRNFLEILGNVAKLRVTFSNSEFDVYSFDEFLSGDLWFSICSQIEDFQFNIEVHRSQMIVEPDELIKSFRWTSKRIFCEKIDETNGFRLFSLPFIDSMFVFNSFSNVFQRNDFDRVENLHLNDSIRPEFVSFFQRLTKLTLILSNSNENFPIRTFSARCVEILLSTTITTNFFETFLRSLPSSVNKLILNRNASKLLVEILEKNDFFLVNIKRLDLTLKNRDELDTILLFLLEPLEKRRLIQLKIHFENPSRSSNIFSGWISKKTCLKSARIDSSDRHFFIWI